MTISTAVINAELQQAAELLNVWPIAAALERLGGQMVTESQQTLDALDSATQTVQSGVATNLIASGSPGANHELTVLRQGIATHTTELTTLGSLLVAHGQRRAVFEDQATQLRAKLAELVADQPPPTTVHDPITTATAQTYGEAVSQLLSQATTVRDNITDEEARTATELDALAAGGVARLTQDPTAYGHHTTAPPKPTRSTPEPTSTVPTSPKHTTKPKPTHPASGGAGLAPGATAHTGTHTHTHPSTGSGGAGLTPHPKASSHQPSSGNGGTTASPKVVGPVIKGKDSWFGGPNDPSNTGQTASGIPESHPGIAIYDEKTLGGYWQVQFPNGKVLILQQTDIGPAPWTGRKVDILYSALPAAGYTESNFPTGSTVTASFLGFTKPPGAI